MFKVLAIGDPHFKVKNSRDTNLLTENVVRVIKEKDPDLVVILGDILDRHELIHQDPLKRITIFLEKITTLKPTILLVGNHDRPNNSIFLTDDHPFHAFNKWNNLTVVDKPLFKKYKNFSFTFVPYVEPGRFIEALNLLEEKWESSTAIFAHQEIKDVKMGHFVSTKGDNWPSSYPLLISGHIHEYSKTNNVIYVGTPYQQAFDESPDKAISLFTFEGKGYEEERIKVNGLPKITIKIKVNEIDKLEVKEDQETKLIIIGCNEDLKTIKKNSKIKELIAKGIKVHYEEEMLIDTTFKIEKKEKTSFISVLEKLVKEEKELLQVFQEVYGRKTVKKFTIISK